MREFERAIERGEDMAVANFVLEQLRKVVRGTEEDDETRPRTDDPARLLYGPLEPFLVESNFPVRAGQIRRASLLPIWQWLGRDGAPEAARAFEAALAEIRQSGSNAGLEGATRKFQLAAADAIIKIATPVAGDDRQRSLARIGPPNVVEDLLSIGRRAAGARDAGYARQPDARPDAGVFGIPDCLGGCGAQRSLAADAAIAAVRAVADHAAAGAAVADHPSRDQDGGIRRRDSRGRHALRHRRHDRAARSLVPHGLPAHGHQAQPFRQCRRATENPARWRARAAHRARSAQRFRMGPPAHRDPRRNFQFAAVGDRERARPGPPHPAPARRQGYRCRAEDRRRGGRRDRRPDRLRGGVPHLCQRTRHQRGHAADLFRPAALRRAIHREPGAGAARRRPQGARLPPDAGPGGDPLLRNPVRP